MRELDGRLAELGRLSAEYRASDEWRRRATLLARQARARAHVEMSGTAVAARLRALSSVSRLCASLARERSRRA